MSSQNYAIVYIITQLDLGGAQKVCLSLFKQTMQDKIPCYLITGTQGILTDSVKHHATVFLLTPLNRQASLKKLSKDILCLWQLHRIIKQLKKKHPHLIVHTHSSKAGILGRWAAFFARVPRVHTVHGFAFHEYQPRIKRFLIYASELLSSLITTHFVCVSSADVTTGKKLFPFFSKNHSLIRAAIDEQFFVPAVITKISNKASFIFGSIACFKPQKNIIDTLRAFEYVHQRNNNVKLELIGDGEGRGTIEQWISNHKLAQAIKLHGWQQDVKKYLLLWDAFVLSSLWEGLPCAIIEAQRCDLPVIAYATGGISDVIDHGKNGLLCEPLHWQDLGQSMLRLSSDHQLYKKICSHAGNFEEFHEKHMYKEHKKLYARFIFTN